MEYFSAKRKIKFLLKDTDPEYRVQRVVNFLFDHFAHYNWVGIYRVNGNELVLGPWKGTQATEHTHIPVGKGICGSAAKSGKTEIVDDISSDHRYLSCFLSTKSEIVVPIKRENIVVGEIDIDSDVPAAFSKQDKVFLEKVADMLSQHI